MPTRIEERIEVYNRRAERALSHCERATSDGNPIRAKEWLEVAEVAERIIRLLQPPLLLAPPRAKGRPDYSSTSPGGVTDRIAKGYWPPDISLSYQCPNCGDEVDIREADAL